MQQEIQFNPLSARPAGQLDITRNFFSWYITQTQATNHYYAPYSSICYAIPQPEPHLEIRYELQWKTHGSTHPVRTNSVCPLLQERAHSLCCFCGPLTWPAPSWSAGLLRCKFDKSCCCMDSSKQSQTITNQQFDPSLLVFMLNRTATLDAAPLSPSTHTLTHRRTRTHTSASY